MSTETFQTLIKKSQKFSTTTISFCGLGEPLLHKNFCRYVEYIRRHTDFAIELTTNGALLTNEIISELIKNRVDLTAISFPSITKNNYEKIMPGLTYEDVLARTLSLIKASQGIPGIEVVIAVVETKFNQHEIPAIKAFFNAKGIGAVVVQLHNRGGYLRNMYNLIDKEYYLAEMAKRTELRMKYCAYLLSTFYIAWDGTALLCCCDLENSFQLGNIKKTNLNRIDKLQRAIAVINPTVCKNCTAR